MLDDSNNSEDYLLTLANNILSIFNSSDKIENEEDLFSDEFYISVISVLIQEGELDIQPGKTAEEKVKNLKILLELLSGILEADLSQIDVKAMIMKHDKKSAKELLELLFSLVHNILKANLDEDVDLDDEEMKSHSFNENKLNLSAKKPKEKMRLDKDEEIDLENLESLRLGKDKNKDKSSQKKEKEKSSNKKENSQKEESEEEKKDNLKEDEKEEIKKIDLDDEEVKINESQSNKKSNKIDIGIDNEDEGFEGEEEKVNLNNSKEKEIDDVNLLNDSNDIKINHITDSEKNNISIKKSNEIPNLLGDEEENSDFKKAKNQFEEMRLSGQDNSDLGINYSMHQANSVPQTQNKLHLPSASEENDMDKDDEFDYNYNENEDKKSKKEDSVVTNSNLNNISQNKSNKKNKDNNNSKSIHQSTDKKENKKNSSSKKNVESSNKKDKTKDKNEINESEKLNAEGGEGGVQGGEPEGKKEVEGEQNPINQEQKNSQTNEEENVESPLVDEAFKYELMKEFRRIYGDKLDNIFLKHNMEISRNTLELALRNIKLAKQKMMKISNRIPEVDDLKTKEYLLKYEKERQMMEMNYNKDQKKLNFFEQRAINNFKQNIKDMKKTKEIEARKTEIEIERRRKAQEVRNHHNQIKFCNEIYQRALQLEKEKNLEKIKKKREINKKENEDKRLAMERIENYYKDQIRLLREILANEKKQKEIEHRAHIQMLSKLEKEKRNEYKKELDNIFDRFDQEEKKNEFERKNKKELAKIFDSYYGSK